VHIDTPIHFTVPPSLPLGSVAFDGDWTLRDEYAQSAGPDGLVVHYYADRLYIVLDPGSAEQTVTALLDGRPLADGEAGQDVRQGRLILDRVRLYQIVDLKGRPADHQLTLRFNAPGAQAYSITFG